MQTRGEGTPRIQREVIYTWIFVLVCPGGVLSQEGETKASCEDRCDEAYFPGMPCYCNEACIQFENCCFDYLRICNPDAIIPDVWSHFQQHSYRFFEDNTLSSEGAGKRCEEEGGLLASINTQEEAEFISREVLRMRVMSAFIGGSDSLREGYWRWADGETMPAPGSTWNLWYKDQPDNGEGDGDQEDCSIITRYRFWTSPRLSLASFFWADYSCESNAKDVQGFICERTLQCEPNPCQNNATCRYAPNSGQDREFACDCRENFYGTHCDMELKPGENWAFCGETQFTKQSGLLESPLYPLTYPPRVDCTYHIQVSEGHTVALRINHLDIEAGKNCIFDSLTLYDGGSDQDPVLRGPLCGSREFAKEIYSSTNEVTMRFTTDNSVNKAGYSIAYTENECSTGTGDSGCGTRKYFTSSCGRILVATAVTTDRNYCEWIIDPAQGMVVNLTFNEFNIPDTGMDCAGGSLAVYDGSDAGSPLLGRYCGLQFPWSIQSSGNTLSLRLEGQEWVGKDYIISMVYNSQDPDNWKKSGGLITEDKSMGKISSEGAAPLIETDTHLLYKWLIMGTAGNKVKLDWKISSGENASLQIYDGSREDCVHLVNQDLSKPSEVSSGTLVSTTFSLLIVVRKIKEDNAFKFEASYEEQEWDPVLSGCYRPAYQKYTGSPENENTIVTNLEPVVLMVSDQFMDEETPMYNPGLYCKWYIQGEAGSELSLQIVSMNAFPQDQDCTSDGLVIYAGGQTTGTKYGPYCGTTTPNVQLTSSDILVVFYSSTIPRPRNGGILRALVTTSDASCRKDELGQTKTQTLESSCGILLSPNFPGRVPPEDWSWVIDTPEVASGAYFDVYLYYVRGPAIKGGTDCSEFFQLYEVPRDSGSLKHYETTFVRLCQDTDLFIPEATIKIPPYQKLGVALSTVRSPLSQRWEFKLAYTTNVMPRPVDPTREADLCPKEHIYYRGHCYSLFPWVLRHYPETKEEYSFAKTWQGSLDYCEKKNGTLLTIKDEDEAYFIKYTLAHEWFWDKAGTFQTNQRMIFIGLENKDGVYSWTDKSTLAYSDWYWPSPSIYTPVLYPDTDPNTVDLLHTKIPQPTADSGSLCTVMIPLSPHKSLNWAKVPCDYPFQRTSAICKAPVPSNGTSLNKDKVMKLTSPLMTAPMSYSACPKGWLAAWGTCLSMHSNYALINSSSLDTKKPYIPLSYSEAQKICEGSGGHLLTFQHELLPVLKSLLAIWNHSKEAGDVWMATSEHGCSVIKVDKEHRLNEDTKYKHVYMECSDIGTNHNIQNVLCEIATTEMEEKCGSDEYHCENEACVSVDSVCDGVSDCGDNSDERSCGCGHEYFQCEDESGCIPVSLYCDFIKQCPDGSDEIYCVHDACGENQFRCDNKQCINEASVCDFKIDCIDGSDESTETCEGRCRGFQCYSGRCLRGSLQLDLISDCPGLQREDEKGVVLRSSVCPLAGNNTSLSGGEALGKVPQCNTSSPGEEEGSLGLVSDTAVSNDNDTSVFGCSMGTAVQCKAGQARCFERADTCIYDTSRMSPNHDQPIMQSCRDGFHLRTNCGAVDCPGMFHCPNSYCIPFNMLCDGRRDCPMGEDEDQCEDYICPGLLRCKGERHCVPHTKVCDGEVNCQIDGTDEKYCALKDVACVSECNCTGDVISCTDAGLTSLPEPMTGDPTRTVRALLLAGNQLNLTRRTFSKLSRLGRLDLSRNGLRTLEMGLFKDLKNLFELNLANNMIQTINEETFAGLVSLQVLNLHGNMLVRLRVDTFRKLVHLRHLVITDNVLSDVSEDAFDALKNLEEINTDAYKFCCIAKDVEVCTPEADEFSSCEDLMSNSALQVSIWVLGILAFIGNAFVVIWRLNTDRSRVSSFFIINLGFSDLLMGVYMLIIAAVDVFYRGRYIVYADSWKSSALCKVAGVAAMISSEVSVFMLTAITAERFISFVFPLKANNFRMKHARIIAIVGWVVVIVLSVIPALGIPYFGDSFFGRTGVCLPFHLNHEQQPGWEYSVFIFLFLNFVSFSLIIVGYVAIFMVVSRSARGVQSTSSLDEYSLAKKLALIVGTDLACWVPIVLIGFAALGGAKIPPQVAAWIAVFVLPLNSAVNPILYTISAIDFSKLCRRKDTKNHSISNGATSVTVAGDTKASH